MSSKNTRPAIVLTGATGILGSALLAESILRGYRPIAIMRDATLEQARARIRAVLSVYGLRHAAEDVSIAKGDVQRPWLGMDPRTAAGVLGCARAVIHCAASTSFDPRNSHSVWEANVGGASNVIDFLSLRRVPLYHVSTAYVAGARSGVAYETELDDRHGFTNAYERSKWFAEAAVRASFDRGDIRGAIFRPGIIVGSSSDGSISDFQNVYGFFRLIHLAQTRLANRAGLVRIEGEASTPCNFVPVDWTAKALWTIIENDGPSNQTYHLTDASGITLGDMLGWVNAHLDDAGLRFELVKELTGAVHVVEQMARSAFQYYRPYAFRQPRFNMSNTLRATQATLPLPPVQEDTFDRLFHFARSRHWKGALSNVHTTATYGDLTVKPLKPEALPA
ncbi:MAG TPA: SDR family oxidoreductase [Candidatus Hydrogenedentes bacterium]|nr:SDR family oxidoreductase [Candidatus Hydrogenedentota bacterium]